MGLQMLDDLSGVVSPARRHKALEDLRHGRATWVWAWLARDLDASVYQPLRAELQAAEHRRRDGVAGRAPALPARPRRAAAGRARTCGTRPTRSATRSATATGCDDVRDELSWLESHFLEAGHAPAARAVRHRGEEASRGRAR